MVRLDDVPWPDLATGRVVGVYGLCIDDSMEYSAKRDRIRAAQRRWHPDKFGQRYSGRDLCEACSAAVQASPCSHHCGCFTPPPPAPPRPSFGERLHADDRDAILKRVKEVAQAINAMGEQLKAEKG